MVNFSVVVIARNEVKTLPRLVESLKEFQSRGGEIIVYDTGSTDGTQEIATKIGCKVIEVGEKHIITLDAETAKKINDTFIVDDDKPVVKEGDRMFDYAGARNCAAEFAANDMVAMPDCDEVYTKLDLDKVFEIIYGGVEQLEYNFVFSHDPFGNEVVKFFHCKFYNRRKLHWVGIIHEVLAGEARRKLFGEDVIKLEHWQNEETNRSHYLTGLAYDTYLRPDYDRNAHYFARELLWNGRWKSAIKAFERHIQISGWPQEAAQSMIFIGQAHGYLGREDLMIEWYQKAFNKDGSRRESLLQLCEFYRHKDDFQRVACYAEAALAIQWNAFYQNDMRHYEDVPHAYLYWAYWYLGDKKKSRYHLDKALEYSPKNPKYLEDRALNDSWNLNDK